VELGSKRTCDAILVIVDKFIKYSYFIPTLELITALELLYKVIRSLTANYRIPNRFITDRDKLFTSAF
jgi:hypothetical protein